MVCLCQRVVLHTHCGKGFINPAATKPTSFLLMFMISICWQCEFRHNAEQRFTWAVVKRGDATGRRAHLYYVFTPLWSMTIRSHVLPRSCLSKLFCLLKIKHSEQQQAWEDTNPMMTGHRQSMWLWFISTHGKLPIHRVFVLYMKMWGCDHSLATCGQGLHPYST